MGSGHETTATTPTRKARRVPSSVAEWNVMFVLPGETRVISSVENPQTIADARYEAGKVRNLTRTWRVWIEHVKTGERAYESMAEKTYQLDRAVWNHS